MANQRPYTIYSNTKVSSIKYYSKYELFQNKNIWKRNVIQTKTYMAFYNIETIST